MFKSNFQLKLEDMLRVDGANNSADTCISNLMQQTKILI